MRLLTAVFAVSILCLMGANAMADMNVWVQDPLIKVIANAPSPASSAKQITINAVRNEYESAQVVVASDVKIEALEVKVSEVAGPSKVVPQIEARFLGFAPVRRGSLDTPDEYLIAKPPADIADAMLDKHSVSVEPGRNQPVWFTVYVPKSTKPGNYAAVVEIIADGKTEIIPIAIKVHSFTLPDDRTLFVTNWFTPDRIASAHNLQKWSEPHWKMIEAYAHCMAEHRQNTAITPINDLIIGHDDGKGNLTFDFKLFDRFVELFQRAGVIGTIEGGHLGGRGVWTAPDFDASWVQILNPDGSVKPNPGVKTTSEEERKYLSQFLPALQKHLEEKGWLSQYIQHLCDEPIPQNAESYKKLASYVHQYAPKLKIIDACLCSELSGAINIWVPLADHFENGIKFFQDRQKAGDQVWFYTCLIPKGKYLNRLIDFQLIRTRLLHWANFRYGLTGYLHWGLNYWVEDPLTNVEQKWSDPGWLPPGDSHIIYPGWRGPLSSIRFEAMRDGIEDYEMLKLLSKSNPKLAKDICGQVLRSMTDYTLDPQVFNGARLRMIEALDRE